MRILLVEDLGIHDEKRIAEVLEVAGLLEWMSDGIAQLRNLTAAYPSPTTLFVPGANAPDFWDSR